MGSLCSGTDQPAEGPPVTKQALPTKPLPAVHLRVPTHEDAFVWHRLFDDPDVMEFFGGASAELSVYEELTARQRRHDAELGFCFWTLLDAASEPIGFAGAQPWPHAWGPQGKIEIGWRLGRAAWGKGYATAAARATLERVRAAGTGDVVAMVDVRNERSVAVTRRLEMRLEETLTVPGSQRRAHRFGLAL